MSDSARSMNVLKKIIKSAENKKVENDPAEEIIQNYLRPVPKEQKKIKIMGRPKVADKMKAKNFTLCLAPQYLKFLDTLEVKDKKVQGRGRKVRFIIDRYVEFEQRQRLQLGYLKEGLALVEKVLADFSGALKKGQKLDLTSREKVEITKAVNQVQILMKLLSYAPKTLHSLLPRNEWAVVSFCIDWSRRNGISK